MKWNASPAAASLLLAACAGGSNSSLQAAPAGGTVAAQSWQGDQSAPASETWRAADGTVRTRERAQPAPALVAEPTPDLAAESVPEFVPTRDLAVEAEPAPEPIVQTKPEPQRAGASYPEPGADYAPPPAAPMRAPAPRPYTPPQDLPADPTAGMEGPRGSSQRGAGEARYDEIGYAGAAGDLGGAVAALHRALPANSYVEVTSLDTGRTILVWIADALPGGDHPIDLSDAALRQLGVEGARVPVRIRRVNPNPQEAAAIRAGQPAPLRAEAPPVLLTALRRRLPGAPIAAAPAPIPSRPAYRPAPAPVRAGPAPTPRPVRGGYVVQIAALSNAGNAQSLAKSMGGFVKQGGGLHRVQLGPFASRAEAETARAGAARAGHADARVIAAN
jgi:rare lipoprotein A